MPAIIQQRGVLDEQILAGLAAGLAGAGPMRSRDVLEGDAALAEEAVGGLEFGPVRKGLGQRAARRGGQMRGDIHEALAAPRIVQGSAGKFMLGPLGWR